MGKLFNDFAEKSKADIKPVESKMTPAFIESLGLDKPEPDYAHMTFEQIESLGIDPSTVVRPGTHVINPIELEMAVHHQEFLDSINNHNNMIGQYWGNQTGHSNIINTISDIIQENPGANITINININPGIQSDFNQIKPVTGLKLLGAAGITGSIADKAEAFHDVLNKLPEPSPSMEKYINKLDEQAGPSDSFKEATDFFKLVTDSVNSDGSINKEGAEALKDTFKDMIGEHVIHGEDGDYYEHNGKTMSADEMNEKLDKMFDDPSLGEGLAKIATKVKVLTCLKDVVNSLSERFSGKSDPLVESEFVKGVELSDDSFGRLAGAVQSGELMSSFEAVPETDIDVPVKDIEAPVYQDEVNIGPEF